MPKFRRKPVVIDAVQYTEGTMPSELPKGVKVRALGSSMEVYNALHDSWIKFKHGDWLRVDLAPRDVYPIDADTFEDTFEPVFG